MSLSELVKKFTETLEVCDEVVLREGETREDGAHRPGYFGHLTIGEMMSVIEADKKIKDLTEALEAADYLIGRLDRVNKGLPVRDLGEAESAYNSRRPELLKKEEKPYMVTIYKSLGGRFCIKHPSGQAHHKDYAHLADAKALCKRENWTVKETKR